MKDSEKFVQFIKDQFDNNPNGKFKCIICGKLISFKDLKEHSEKCNYKY